MNSAQIDGYIREFSNITISAVKDIISRKQQISAKSLLLNDRYADRLKDLIFDIKNENVGTKSRSSEESGRTRKIELLEQQIATYITQKDDLIKLNTKLEIEITRITSFYINVFAFLYKLLDQNLASPLQNHLKQFMTLLKEKKSIDELETLFTAIKQFSFSSSVKDSCTTFSTPAETFGGDEPSIFSFPVEKAKRHFQNLMDSLKLKMGEKDIRLLAEIEDSIGEIQTFDQAFDTDAKMYLALMDYVERIISERDETTAFIKEISRKIIDVESHIRDSFVSTSEIYRSADDFSNMLQGQVETLKRDVKISETLKDLKDAVVSSLDNIKETIESRRLGRVEEKNDVERQMLLLQENLESMKREVHKAKNRADELEKEVMTDNLTGAYNRRAYDRRIQEELARLSRYGQVFSILFFDVDQFKCINDTYGHTIGDKTLVEIIKRIKAMLRTSDFVARYGGDEFIVILPGTSMESVKETAEKIRNIVEHIDFIYKDERINVTISVGCTSAGPDDENVEEIFKRIDKALYKAKTSGRNRVVCLPE